MHNCITYHYLLSNSLSFLLHQCAWTRTLNTSIVSLAYHNDMPPFNSSSSSCLHYFVYMLTRRFSSATVPTSLVYVFSLHELTRLPLYSRLNGEVVEIQTDDSTDVWWSGQRGLNLCLVEPRHLPAIGHARRARHTPPPAPLPWPGWKGVMYLYFYIYVCVVVRDVIYTLWF